MVEKHKLISKKKEQSVGVPFQVYRPFSVVVGNTPPSITEKNPKYQLNHKKKLDYKIWKKLFMTEYEVDITRKIISEVIDEQFVEISIGDILSIADNHKYFGEYIIYIIMYSCYRGMDYREGLRRWVLYNLQYKNSSIYKELMHR